MRRSGDCCTRLSAGEVMESRLDGARHLRAAPRYKLFQPTEISVAGETRRAHVLNLSAGGALLYAMDPPASGTKVLVLCGGRLLSARVAWREDRRFGLVFLTPLANAEISKVVAAQNALISGASRHTAGD